MKLAEAIKNAVESEDANQLEEVANFMRFKLGLTNEKSLACVQKVLPDMTMSRWDELMMKVDNNAY